MTASKPSGRGAVSRTELVSLPEAAAMLHVSPSTMWRWVDRAVVPAYRLGPKRIFVRLSDLDSLLSPARGPRRGARAASTRTKGGGRRLTARQAARLLAAVAEAREFQKRLGKTFSIPSEQLLREAREERDQALA